MTKSKAHWEGVYSRKGERDVSWFQPSLQVSLGIVERIGLGRDAAIVDVGGGASTLVDDLLDRGFSDISVLDLSRCALDSSRRRLGARAARVSWVEADITAVDLGEGRFDLWHDRAVFHFLTEERARRAYVDTALRALRPGGHIIVATFGLEGPERCSGLEVVRYDAEGLHAEFGTPFDKIDSVRESHTTPWGTEQEFVYCYCRRA